MCLLNLAIREMKIKTPYILPQLEWLQFQNQKATIAGQYMGNGEPSWLLVGVQTGVATVEISVVVPSRTRNRSTMWPDSTKPPLGIYSKDCFLLQRHKLILEHSCSILKTKA